MRRFTTMTEAPIHEKSPKLVLTDEKDIDDFLISVLELPDKESLERLRTRIHRNKGLANIFVHPNFLKGKIKPESAHTPAAQVEHGAARLISQSVQREQGPPSFVFEEERNLDAVRALFAPGSDGVYVIPTEPGAGNVLWGVIEKAFGGITFSGRHA